MGEGRQYNQDDDEEKTSKIKKVTITEEESNVAEADNDDNEPVPNTGDTPVQDREPSDDEPTTDDERYKAASG